MTDFAETSAPSNPARDGADKETPSQSSPEKPQTEALNARKQDAATPTPGAQYDSERNRLSARIGRVANVGVNLTGAAASFGVNRVIGGDDADARIAKALKDALGRTKGPLMKAAQLVATIPDALPPEFAKELATLQAHAPAMGWSFVKRRMRVELGRDWETKFQSFEREAAHAASLGQVHRAVLPDGRNVACKLQYPDMASAVEADLDQIKTVTGLIKRLDGSIDSSQAIAEVGERLREELDYAREAKAMRLYQDLLSDFPQIAVPDPVEAYCTPRLLTMTWLDGEPITDYVEADQATRNTIATGLFHCFWGPMTHAGVIHGDPHLGNYAITRAGQGLNLLDFGCIRIFPPLFVDGVVKLYRALLNDDFDATVAAYEQWGFGNLKRELIETLNLWARFIYGPLLDPRVRTIADGISPGEYGRKEAMNVRRLLKQHGPVTIPAEFVFMDRAAIGLGSAFLRLGAELNFHQLFEDSLDGFSEQAIADRQSAALARADLEPTG